MNEPDELIEKDTANIYIMAQRQTMFLKNHRNHTKSNLIYRNVTVVQRFSCTKVGQRNVRRDKVKIGLY